MEEVMTIEKLPVNSMPPVNMNETVLTEQYFQA